jgi:hypothetical protein
MPWALLDVGFHDHPKVLALLDEPDALAAIGLWTLVLAWAKGHCDPDSPASAGSVPPGLLRRLGGDDHLASLLVKAGLWREAPDGSGWIIHEFAGWQQLEAWRVKRETGRKGGRPRRSEPSGNHMVEQKVTISQSHDMTGQSTTGSSKSSGSSSAEGGAGGVPTCPGTTARGTPCTKPPRPGSPYCSSHDPKTPKSTRLPDEFSVTREMVAWARKEVPAVDGRAETRKFEDYFRSASGSVARKTDWEATWRNWMRKADERGRSNGYRPDKPGTLDEGFWER